MADETQPPAPDSPPTPDPAAERPGLPQGDGSSSGGKPTRTRRLVIAGCSLVAVAVVVAALVTTLGGPTKLRAAVEDCDLAAAVGVRLEDDDRTLIFNTQGTEDILGADIADVACALNALEMPSRIVNLIDSTRALDGRQTDSWDGLTATWSYHPDDGLDLMVTED